MPELYQLSELCDLSLVDPDNRRQVDFAKRMMYLKEIRERQEKDILLYISEILSSYHDGRLKQFLIQRVLKARGAHRELFEKGECITLVSEGAYANNIFSFARRFGNKWAVVIAPRFLTGVVEKGNMPLGKAIWKDTSIKLREEFPAQWIDCISSQPLNAVSSTILAGEALVYFPVALLMGGNKEGRE